MFLPIGDNVERRVFPFLPMALILANVMIFAVQMRILFTDPAGAAAEQDFLKTWGLTPSVLARGELPGLLTHMFVHGGLMHLAGNMIVLWAFACSLEAALGCWTLLGFYLIFGLAGGLAHAALDWSSEIPMVGASGAIAGLIGAYTVLFGARSKIRALVFLVYRPFQVEIPATLFGAGWIGLQLWSASCDPQGLSGVAWCAHVGGFAAGALIMWICRNDTKLALAEDGNGNLTFVEEDAPALRALEIQRLEADENFPLPQVCPSCRQQLAEEHRLAYNLARCGNPSCERLIYVALPDVHASVGAK